MLASAPAYMLKSWRDYYALEPFGPERFDLQIGQIAAMLHNHWSKPSAKRLYPSDFLMNAKFDDPPEQTAEGQIAAARLAAAASKAATASNGAGGANG